MLQVPELFRLADADTTAAQLEARETQCLDREHGRAVADPAEPCTLDNPPSRDIDGDGDYGKVGASSARRADPPSLSLRVNLGRLTDVQPYPHRRRPGKNMCRSQYAAWRDQIP